MKKFAAILLALMLCMGLALAETADVTGTWHLNEVISGEISINPGVLGMDMSITLNADGTATGDVAGETGEGTWSMEGGNVIVAMSGDPMTFTLEDGNLVSVVEGSTMIFGREKAEVTTVELGEARTDVTLADFNGQWNATIVDMMGMQIPVTDMGMLMTITIADGQVTLTEGEGEAATTSTGSATLENGVLTVKPEDETDSLPLTLHESGLLAALLESDGLSMGIYFEKAE